MGRTSPQAVSMCSFLCIYSFVHSCMCKIVTCMCMYLRCSRDLHLSQSSLSLFFHLATPVKYFVKNIVLGHFWHCSQDKINKCSNIGMLMAYTHMVHMLMCACKHTYMHTYIHTYIHTYTNAHMYGLPACQLTRAALPAQVSGQQSDQNAACKRVPGPQVTSVSVSSSCSTDSHRI